MPRKDYPSLIQDLVLQLRRMPGIGPRSAERIALWMIQAPNARAKEIAAAIEHAEAGVNNCLECGFFAEGKLCAFCLDSSRDQRVICVVEQPTDVLPLERTGDFQGIYHALGGRLSPLDRVGPEDLRISHLQERVARYQPREIILALSADVEGEATMNYLVDLLGSAPWSITRMAQGLPAGSGLDNADELTISRALAGRTALPSKLP